MQSIVGKVKASISYLISFTEMDVIISHRLCVQFRIAVIRFVCSRPYHDVFGIIGIARPVTDLAIGKVFSAVFIHRHRFYMQAVTRKIETPVRYLIAFTKMDVIISLCLFLFLLVRVV